MSKWSEGQIYTNGVNLHYYRTGGDKQPVVLLHGFTENGLCWTRVARDLKQDYDVIMYDARGHGLSDGPITDFTPNLLTEDAASIIQILKLERPFLLGHSMGAATAARVASYHPKLIRAIALEDPPWHNFTSGLAIRLGGKLAIPFLKKWIKYQKAQTREEIIDAAKKSNPSWLDEEFEAWADSKKQLNMDVFKNGPPVEQWREIISRIICPTLLITADPARGAIVGREIVKEIESTWHNARVLHIDGAGHNIRREQYAAYIATIKSFFSEI